ncbi:unnamed protein product [Sphagnum balticum]
MRVVEGLVIARLLLAAALRQQQSLPVGQRLKSFIHKGIEKEEEYGAPVEGAPAEEEEEDEEEEDDELVGFLGDEGEDEDGEEGECECLEDEFAVFDFGRWWL